MSSLERRRYPFSIKYPEGWRVDNLSEDDVRALMSIWERDEKIFSKRK